ncbi:MAG TPA: aminotransferase class IV [Ktedonobacteraceae bacterium]|nr:aminotransferase class IV [Ktedonobacteraceae bacterium]
MDNSAFWYIDGRWVHPDEASISISDIAVLRGYSVFDSLRTYNRRPFHLGDHLSRLSRSAELIEMNLPLTKEKLTDLIHEAIERNEYKHAAVRILVTGGPSDDGILPGEQPGLAIMVTPLPERDPAYFEKGCRLITTRLQRITPEAKTANYVSAVRALKQAKKRMADDALFVNNLGHVLEATRSNFFIFKGNTLVTPRVGILTGVTRNVVLELARGRFEIEERPILLDELWEANEAFVTSSSREITPVLRIDDLHVNAGTPGSNTRELENRFIAMVEAGNF